MSTEQETQSPTATLKPLNRRHYGAFGNGNKVHPSSLPLPDPSEQATAAVAGKPEKPMFFKNIFRLFGKINCASCCCSCTVVGYTDANCCIGSIDVVERKAAESGQSDL